MQVYAADKHALAHAKCYDLLARAYNQRVEGTRSDNIELCIVYWKLALRGPRFTCFTGTKVQILTQKVLLGFGRLTHSAHWARIQASLGSIYKKRLKGAPSLNLGRMLTYADVC